MAHTDRDDERWFWTNHHSRECVNAWRRARDFGDWSQKRCDTCRQEPKNRPWWMDEPSWWHRDCRREERARSRTQMARARTGHTDWDDLTISYRRPYYW